MLRIFLSAILIAVCSAKCNNPGSHPDLPRPPTTDVTLKTGDWIIPMDNQQSRGGSFDFHVYGYAVRLLWAGMPLEWVIKGCKSTSDNDIERIRVRQIFPEWAPNPSMRSFKHGVFILRRERMHYAGISERVYQAMVRQLQTNVRVFIVAPDQEQVVEVRHRWAYKPAIGLLGVENPTIHSSIFRAAGLIENHHWSAPGLKIEEVLGPDSCYTFMSNPHDGLSDGPARAVAIHRFVSAGGNFMAQCHGVRAYGAQANSRNLQLLLNTPGAGGSSCPRGGAPCAAISDGGRQSRPKLTQPDQAYVQVDYDAEPFPDQGGSWRSGSVSAAQGNYDENTAYLEIVGDGSFKAMAGTIRGYTGTEGGMIYYLGGHAFTGGSVGNVNGQRMLLNAALVPATTRAAACNLGIRLARRRRLLSVEGKGDGDNHAERNLLSVEGKGDGDNHAERSLLSVEEGKGDGDNIHVADETVQDTNADARRNLQQILVDDDDIPVCENGLFPNDCDYAAVCSEAPACLSTSTDRQVFAADPNCRDDDQCLAGRDGFRGLTCSSAAQYCNNFAGVMDACCPQTCGRCDAQRAQLTCFPWYCGDCRAVWMHQASRKTFSCSGTTREEISLPPIPAPTPRTLRPTNVGETLRPSIGISFQPRTRAPTPPTPEFGRAPTIKPLGFDTITISGLTAYNHFDDGQEFPEASVTMTFSDMGTVMDFVNLPECQVTDDANSCGLHVHEGRTCEEWVGLHFYNKPNDPWLEKANHVSGTGSVSVDFGGDLRSTLGRTLVLHGPKGEYMTCDIIDESQTVIGPNPTPSGATSAGVGVSVAVLLLLNLL